MRTSEFSEAASRSGGKQLSGGKRLLIAALILLLLFACATRLLSFLLVPPQYTRVKVHVLENDPPEDLILGTSHGIAAIDPDRLAASTGRTTYNAAAGGEYPIDIYYLAKDTVSSGAPRRLIVEYDPTYWLYTGGMNNTEPYLIRVMRPSLTKAEYFLSSCLASDFRNALEPWYLNLSGLRSIPENVRRKQSDAYRNYSMALFEDPLQTVMENGFIAIDDSAQNGRDSETHVLISEDGAASKAYETSRRWFLRTVDLCRKNGIGLVVVETPIPSSTLAGDRAFFEDMNARMRKMAEENGFVFLDYVTGQNAVPDGTDIVCGTDGDGAPRDDGGFSDAEGHMRVSAARRFSDVFGKALSRLP